MVQSVRNAMRSWMFIYVGLFAAIVGAAMPADSGEARLAETSAPAISIDAPISRSDICRRDPYCERGAAPSIVGGLCSRGRKP